MTSSFMPTIDLSTLPTIDADVPCPDANRSPTGAWVLPGRLVPRVEELQAQDPSLTRAQCFEQLGAEWDDEYNAPPPEGMVFFFTDPEKTVRTRVSDGTEYRGAWVMTQAQKAEADAAKREHAEWGWKRCVETAGGTWTEYYFSLELDDYAHIGDAPGA
ncbi:hypothetical protein CC86DRAFT_374780 [Ophiobolus disseminans]|uniref:Uncharacterized protein n=1 Tax=Ophiobolus disseminans TaxID=1469910 RepID=A0A6A6ZG45_9PLEO|nr:hypothetical protein CC86DRAFT_374780 [Ophiobolus disseminans]